jgi:signal transduction histidine kinase/CheY-like chemotaxis protein
MDLKWIYVNRPLADYLGMKREDMIGKHCSTANVEICGTAACAAECAKRGERETFFTRGGVSYRVSVEVLRGEGGEPIGFIEVMQDITAVQREARRRADAESEAKSMFLATMSHEMRTPLNAITGMTAIGKKSDDPAYKNYALTRIEEASSHLLAVINDVLDMSKIEANRLELAPVEFDFEGMLQKVIMVNTYRLNEKDQGFAVNVDSAIPAFIVGDDSRLAQVVTNLLSNAIKFTPNRGEIRLTASLLGEKDGLCELQVSVADNGIGIAPEQQDKLFEAFGQAENGISREYGGTGLGLAISKRIVELMGGGIKVESKPGHGSKFTFTVKVRAGQRDARSRLSPHVEWEKVRVLVADDSAVFREYFKESFERLGIRCETAEDGMEACRAIELGGGFSIYFVDWYMPEMDGILLTKWIKARGDKAPVILVSTAGWESLKNSSESSGAEKCLTKPLLSSTIVDCMNEFLGPQRKEDDFTPGGEFAGKRMLIAEDMDINREIMIALLDGTGLAIDCAGNGKEALDAIAGNPGLYGIVFMDVQMPVMDGLEATRRIRRLIAPGMQELPIVAMTANAFKEDVAACLAAGMNGHLGKPLDVGEVFATLRRYLL